MSCRRSSNRIRGGTRGILAALDTGRLDPLSAWLPDTLHLGPLTKSDERRQLLREARRRRAFAIRSPF